MTQDWKEIGVDWTESERQPAPSEHSPRKEQIYADGYVIVHEEHEPAASIKMDSEHTLEVRQ